MSELRECPSCGTPLPSDAPGGLCPQCLLESATVAPSGGGSGSATIIGTKRPSPGSTYGGYKIFRPLGKGGMGEVWEAEHVESGRRVALKVLGQALDSTESRGRFLREGRLAASVNHPNSVYVFGTEEIDGTPVIAMELVSGGTLHERIRDNGPMPVAEAVDTILQIIAGLEAAQSIGILHRDVKPSNCFVEPDGSVKVGDFGLSISTSGRADANITVAGSVLGTPAFSSPEQLRGDELSVRSDIYSVGVTLYYLLTGRTPFEAENFVKLLSRVIEEQPTSPVTYRKEIPQGLARLVLRCLAKQPSERFKDYAEMRRALFGYSSTAPSPATLGLRFAAGCLDTAFLTFCSSFIHLLVIGDVASVMNPTSFKSPAYIAAVIGSMIGMFLYYAIGEGKWGTTPGKAICGLRVQLENRQIPGIPRALLRQLVFVLVPQLPLWIYYGRMLSNPDVVLGEWSVFLPYYYYVGMAILFSTARRRNGFAALQDLASGTRVVLKSAYQERPRLLPTTETEPVKETETKTGPYHVLGPIGEDGQSEWRLGYDTKLLRKVWLHLQPEGTPPVAAVLKSLNRPGRLRWLNACRPESGSKEPAWDAYEGLGGRPLIDLLEKPQPWSSVRYWVLDLAEELAQAGRDGTTPMTLALDRVWITEGGRAKLLDFTAPGIRSPNEMPDGPNRSTGAPPPLPLTDQKTAFRFLGVVTVAALTGRKETPDADSLTVPDNPQPLSVRKFLEKLPGFGSLTEACAALRPLLQRNTRVSRVRRAAMVAGCIAVPLIAVLGAQMGQKMLKKWKTDAPEVMEINLLLGIRMGEKIAQRFGATGNDENLVGIYIARHYRDAIKNPEIWNSMIARMIITGEKRRYAEESLVKFANPSEEEIRRAEKRLSGAIKSVDTGGFLASRNGMIITAMAGLAFYVAIPAMIAALLFRGGLVMRAAGVVVVKNNGASASRWRVFLRALIIWTPILSLPIVYQLGRLMEKDLIMAVVVGLLGCVTVWSTRMSGRGIPDRLARTWLVPR